MVGSKRVDAWRTICIVPHLPTLAPPGGSSRRDGVGSSSMGRRNRLGSDPGANINTSAEVEDIPLKLLTLQEFLARYGSDRNESAKGSSAA